MNYQQNLPYRLCLGSWGVILPSHCRARRQRPQARRRRLSGRRCGCCVPNGCRLRRDPAKQRGQEYNGCARQHRAILPSLRFKLTRDSSRQVPPIRTSVGTMCSFKTVPNVRLMTSDAGRSEPSVSNSGMWLNHFFNVSRALVTNMPTAPPNTYAW